MDKASGEVSLLDFRFARAGKNISPAPLPLQNGNSMLSFMSPEQTGRMNRSVDYRTDLYSLGITFYQLLTGSRPCPAGDMLELIHWHIARTATAPNDVDPLIPAALSDIVMKLLSKTAEQRYQSALGVYRDLETCAQAWTDRREIPVFPLARRDVSDRFLIPQKLYGRDGEVATLEAAFERVCGGPSEIVLVSGYSGIGKTSRQACA